MNGDQMTNETSETTSNAFLAIDLPNEIKQELAVFIHSLKEHDQKTHWTRSENLHITLKFLGNISAEEQEKVIQIVTPIIRSHRHFDLSFNKIFYLPACNSSRIIALSPTPISPLASLAIDIEHALIEQGFKPEKKEFKPHMTLGSLCSKTHTKKFYLPKIGKRSIEYSVLNTVFKSTSTVLRDHPNCRFF